MVNFLTGTGMEGTVIMLVMMVAVFYFMLIRPESKRKKQEAEMRANVRNGDKIVTIGGICGTVVDVKEDRVVIETSKDQVRIELAKFALGTNETQEAARQAQAKKAQEAKAKEKAAKKAEKAGK